MHACKHSSYYEERETQKNTLWLRVGRELTWIEKNERATLKKKINSHGHFKSKTKKGGNLARSFGLLISEAIATYNHECYPTVSPLCSSELPAQPGPKGYRTRQAVKVA